MSSAGLYVHLPYCRSRCGYCAFVVTTDESSKRSYLAALAREIALVAPEAREEVFDSLYLGGGTPSLIPAGEIARLIESLRSWLRIDPDSEITLEANPDDVSLPLARCWRQAGVTRVSVGVQSFDDRELAAVGRRHAAADAERALEVLLAAGLHVSGDLILGLPEQTVRSFRTSVARLLESGVEHVSLYLLETDKSKAIEEDRGRHPSRYLTDDSQADLWLEMSAHLEGAGLRHYEISNWARPGREAKHNVKYWTRSPTLGLGVSAHELWKERRRANVSAIPAYISSLEQGRRPVALDREVSDDERGRERIMLGLRLTDGVSPDEVEKWIARSGDERLAGDWQDWRAAGLLDISTDRVRLTERGFLLSNEILCRFV